MIDYDLQFLGVLNDVYRNGVDHPDRTGTGTRKIFDAKIKVDLDIGDPGYYALPVLSLRKVFPRTPWYELLWILRGSSDVSELRANRIHIWDANSSREFLDKRGLNHLPEWDIGEGTYGPNMRRFGGHYDQLVEVIKGIREDPYGRRHYINLWNPCDLHKAALPPCHISYNFVVVGGKLNLKFGMRSHDLILANNSNLLVASYFLILMANWCELEVGEVVQDIADCHIYHNLMDAAKLLLGRTPISRTWKSHKIIVSPFTDVKSLDDELDSLFFDSDSFVKIFGILNKDVKNKTNPAIPEELMAISA